MVAGKAKSFVTEKLEERNARHRRMGDSRYVVEPNVKEGKGGLRDLHTLFWIGKYAYQVTKVADLVEVGLLSETELHQFQRAERFLWAVRCHLHLVAGRAEERLTFDYQREIAARMRYADRPGKSPVERFMRHYFLHAKTVGDLTGVFLAHLDEKFARKGGRFGLPTIRRRPEPARRLRPRPRPARLAARRLFPRGSGPAPPDLRPRRPLRARNPPAGDARRRPRRQAGRRGARRSRGPTPSSSTS